MNMLNTLNGALRGTPNSGTDALLQMGNAAAGSGTRDSAFAGLLKNFDSLGANDAAPKPTESTPSPADPAPAKAEQAKPAETQRLQSQTAAQGKASTDPQDATSSETADAQATAQAAGAEQPAKPAETKKDAKDTTTQAKSDAADEKTTTTDAPQTKRSRKLLADAGSTATAQAAAQDKAADPAAATGPVSAKPSKVGADVCELPAGTDPSAKSAAGQSAVAQAQGRAVDRAQDQQVADRGQQIQAQFVDLGDAQTLQAVAAQSFANELKSVMPAQGGARSGGIEGLAAAAQAGATASTTAAANDDSASAPVIVNITPQLDDAGFASELGARLTVLAQDGVQHAELHLNPADMGPVAVNIKLDGQQAQVTFHAAQADTRSVLEQGLPDLAAALAGAGLTLAGGGVFQQSQGGRERDGASGPASGQNGGAQGVDATAAAIAQPVRVAQPRGVVDVYA